MPKVHSPDASPAADESAPQLVEQIISRAEQTGASDVHLHLTGQVAHVSYRLDGFLTPPSELPGEVAERVFGRIKYLARLKTYQESLPQDGRINKADVHARNDIRVATYPTVSGEKIVLRLFNQTGPLDLPDLQLPPAVHEALAGFLRQTGGLLLLTGPAGSGKTTTIYACLRQLAVQGGRHIITVEDPVEQVIPGVMQTEVNEAAGLDYATAARHLLRQDPQVLVIGEIRDEVTANLALRSALTGHLVIATLHAGSCRGVVERLWSMSADHYTVTAALGLVLNQRLVRRLCAVCRGTGCADCLSTGYRGRLPVAEFMAVTDAVRQTLRTQGPAGISADNTLEQAARELCRQELTNEAEINRVLGGMK